MPHYFSVLGKERVSSETNAGQQVRNHANETETTRTTPAPAPIEPQGAGHPNPELLRARVRATRQVGHLPLHLRRPAPPRVPRALRRQPAARAAAHSVRERNTLQQLSFRTGFSRRGICFIAAKKQIPRFARNDKEEGGAQNDMGEGDGASTGANVFRSFVGAPLLAGSWQGTGSSEPNAGQQRAITQTKTETTRVATAPAPCDKAARSGAPTT